MTINYPDGITQVFNPHYIEVEGATASALRVVIPYEGEEQRYINFQTYNGKAKVFISRLMQLCFNGGEYCKELTINIVTDEGGRPFTILSFTTMALWGVRKIDDVWLTGGEAVIKEGASPRDNQPMIRHKMVRFGNLPFSFDLFLYNDNESATGHFGTATEIVTGNGLVEVDLSGARNDVITYDMEWNINRYQNNNDLILSIASRNDAFITLLKGLVGAQITGKKMLEQYVIEKRNEENGYYLRFRDRHGFIRYFLFAKGNTGEKITETDYSVEAESIVAGEYYQNQVRVSGKTSQDVIDACAVHLDEQIVDYVRDIITSPEVDLYMGKNARDKAIWQPVNIISGTYTMEPDCNAKLQNYTIKFALPVYEAQHL